MAYDLSVNVEKNRLYIFLSGNMDEAEIQTHADHILLNARGLRPGFSVISDIASFVPVGEAGRLVMQQTMKMVKELGMGHVVRVVTGASLVTANQWQRTSRQVGYQALEAPSREEAERLLDQLTKSGN